MMRSCVNEISVIENTQVETTDGGDQKVENGRSRVVRQERCDGI